MLKRLKEDIRILTLLIILAEPEDIVNILLPKGYLDDDGFSLRFLLIPLPLRTRRSLFLYTKEKIRGEGGISHLFLERVAEVDESPFRHQAGRHARLASLRILALDCGSAAAARRPAASARRPRAAPDGASMAAGSTRLSAAIAPTGAYDLLLANSLRVGVEVLVAVALRIRDLDLIERLSFPV